MGLLSTPLAPITKDPWLARSQRWRFRLWVAIATTSSPEHDGGGQHPGEQQYPGPEAEDVLGESKRVNGNAADEQGSPHEDSGPAEPPRQHAAGDDGAAAKCESDSQIYGQSAQTLLDMAYAFSSAQGHSALMRRRFDKDARDELNGNPVHGVVGGVTARGERWRLRCPA